MTDGNWTFSGLEGTNGATRVTCEGEMTTAAAGHNLALRFRAGDVPLEDELRNALRPAMQQVWDDLRPRGMIDLTAEISYKDGPNLLSVTVRAEPHSETTSIEPARFSYRLEKLQGVFTYRNGRVTMEHLKAEHRAVKVAGGGFCEFLPDGGWHMRLDGLTVDRLRVDRDLHAGRARAAAKDPGRTQPHRLVEPAGKSRPGRRRGGGQPVRSQWEFALGLQQAALGYASDRLENICGGLTLTGGYNGRNFYSCGELAMDSLIYKERQFTRLMGPLWIDDQQVLLGSGRTGGRAKPSQTAPRGNASLPDRRASTAAPSTATPGCCSAPQPRYGIRANLVDGQLARWAQENLAGRQNLKGRIMASVELQGAGHTRNTLSGRGTMQLRDANVYELPLMISMLKLLSIRAPDANAFSSSDIDFHVQGEHVYFDHLNFTGDAISLLGKGEMNMQSEIHLAFTAIVGRGDLPVPIVRELFTGASQQFLVIYVDGPLQNPDMQKEAFPGAERGIAALADRSARQEHVVRRSESSCRREKPPFATGRQRPAAGTWWKRQ